MRVYKGTDKDMRCRDMQYELGTTVKSDDAIRCGDKGFHSCEAPLDILRYYPLRGGNRYFAADAGGKIDRSGTSDSKLASSELTLMAEVSLNELAAAQVEFVWSKTKSGATGSDDSNLAGGDWSNLAGGNWSNLAGGNWSNLVGGNWSNLVGGNGSNLVGDDHSNLAGGDRSNLAGGNWSNLAGGNWSNLVGDDHSNLAGGDRSNLAGGNWSNLAGGYWSNLAGGNWSNLVGGNWSNLVGGEGSLIVGRNAEKAKGGLHSVIVLTQWELIGESVVPTCVRAEIVDGVNIKPDTWYALSDGELVEVK